MMRSVARRRRVALCGAVVLVALAALYARCDVTARVERVLRVEPRALAHLLADWRTQRLLQPHLAGAGAWRVHDESGSTTRWRYSVRAACGARCTSRGWLEALERADGAHELRVTHRACRRPTLLPWPEFCEEWQSVAVVSEAGVAGAGQLQARYSEACAARCWRWDVWRGACHARLKLALEQRATRLLHAIEDKITN